MALINASRKQLAPRVASEDSPAYRAHPINRDSTANRLRAFSASMQPIVDDAIEQRIPGMLLIERLAYSAQGDNLPTLRLSIEECAELVTFIRASEPVAPRNWWKDPSDTPSQVCGFYNLLMILERNLEAAGERS